jgi:hypothetical protein
MFRRALAQRAQEKHAGFVALGWVVVPVHYQD